MDKDCLTNLFLEIKNITLISNRQFAKIYGCKPDYISKILARKRAFNQNKMILAASKLNLDVKICYTSEGGTFHITNKNI